MNEKQGQRMYDLANQLFPICRSITGEGVRETLQILSDYISADDGIGFSIKSVSTGTRVFDWDVPKEWKIIDAYIEDSEGNRIIDFRDNNLHVVGYSIAVDRWVGLKELKEYIYVQDDQPDVVPYVTSYYEERYGFCMSKNQRDSLKDGKYHMYIDSELFEGELTYAELILEGKSKKEVFFSTYACHPSMANDECSGPALMAELIRYVKRMERRKYTYRFLIVPETIGSITYLSEKDRLDYMKSNVKAGFVLSCVGDDRDYSIIQSKYANTVADKVLENVLAYHTNNCYSNYSFLERGSDERQYNSAGVDLPVVGFCRSKYGAYSEYHTSADDMTLVSPEGFQGSYDCMVQVIEVLENNNVYKMKVCCEPQFGKRGLYATISQRQSRYEVPTIVNVTSYADGKNDLIDISNIIGVSVEKLIEIVAELKECDLIEEVNA